MKNKIKEYTEQAKTVWTNFVELVEAVSLLTVSIFSGYMAYYHYHLDSIHTVLLLAASVIILLIGMKYTINHFKKGQTMVKVRRKRGEPTGKNRDFTKPNVEYRMNRKEPAPFKGHAVNPPKQSDWRRDGLTNNERVKMQRAARKGQA